jgi:hypothetical protein
MDSANIAALCSSRGCNHNSSTFQGNQLKVKCAERYGVGEKRKTDPWPPEGWTELAQAVSAEGAGQENGRVQLTA